MQLVASSTVRVHFLAGMGAEGILAPSGGLFLLLKSSHICSKVTHSTPSCLLIYSMILDPISKASHMRIRTRQSPNLPLMHKKNMRTTRHIRMNSHGKDKLIVLAIEVVKMILPEHQLHQKAPSSNELNPLGRKRSKLTFQSSSTSLGFTQP